MEQSEILATLQPKVSKPTSCIECKTVIPAGITGVYVISEDEGDGAVYEGDLCLSCFFVKYSDGAVA